MDRVSVVGNFMRFEVNTAHHHHFVCRRCGAIHDVFLKEVEQSKFASDLPPGCVADWVQVELRGTSPLFRERVVRHRTCPVIPAGLLVLDTMKGRTMHASPTVRSVLLALFAPVFLVPLIPLVTRGEDPWAVYEGEDGPGKGKHIVLIGGDEEYRSEEAMPSWGKSSPRHHGFRCTVLFAIDDDGTINPARNDISPASRRSSRPT